MELTAQPIAAPAAQAAPAPQVFKWNNNSGYGGGSQNSARTNFQWGL